MAMSQAESAKKYREKIKKDKVKYEAAKAKARVRAQKFGLIPKPTHHRTSVQLSAKLKKDIYNFYVRDDVSYQLPGKRDTIVVKDDDGQKTTYQKRILINNLRENYELFKVENKNVDLSRSAFADLRPPFVVCKAALAHRVCVCVYHANVDLFLKSLDKCIAEKVCSSLETFTQSLVCNTENEECMFSQCPLCENFFRDKVEQKVIDGNVQIKWLQWANENGRAEKKEYSGSVDEAVQLLGSKIEHFKFHVFVKREQSKYFEKLKTDVTDEKVVCQVDFAENYGMKEQDEVQSAHWYTKTMSIFYVWSKSEGFVQFASEYKISMNWCFFATSHGKGTVDAIGGVVKRVVWSAVLGGEACRSTADFVRIAKKKSNSIILMEITKNHIDNSKLKLENIFKATKHVPETLKSHSVKVIDRNSIATRY
ncbi:unnamed protein product [Didymodactylos carnosus]|uniref:Uncharacterized protein n=1 Tax=Didymodactylos carnosus TaxID=1234261 RepID=A0A8S2DGR0_9BILA|nr:unnamed protein product [Didymodactylos carnosus]CAF3681810.1 unnamed protein product [Didymodactylos carnosus]